jgi:hypothetical protein
MEMGAAEWAAEEFGQAALGDKRRTARLVRMGGRMLEHRAGKVTEVFASVAEQEGAYRLLENDKVSYESVVESGAVACARRCREYAFVFVPVDGTSAKLADPHGKKDFGAVGTYEAGARGLKVLSAIALSPAGEPLGLCAQEQWTRPPQPKKRRTLQHRGHGAAAKARRRANAQQHRREKRRRMRRPAQEKETRYWWKVIRAVKKCLAEHAASTRCWFQLDREGDAWETLQTLLEHRPTDLFTVRSNCDRCVWRPDGSESHLRAELASEPVLGGYSLDVAAGKKRTARRAHLEIRATSVLVDARNRRTEKHCVLPLNAVWAREVGTTPLGEKPVEWLLLTNYPVHSLADAELVLYGYSQRWQIEEVHKTWKSGGCQVEQSQLHTAAAAMKWATLLFAVAVRLERLKYLARSSPDAPASVELSPYEIRALIILKRQQKKRTETVPDAMPTIAQAARWIADLGGYTGKPKGGSFGSITLGRGLPEGRRRGQSARRP